MSTHAGFEPWRRANPMEFEEADAGYVLRGEGNKTGDAPLRIYVTGDEDEITRLCVNELRCWSCHENFPAPLGIEHWPEWVAKSWGNPSEDHYHVRRQRVQNHCCPICGCPSGPQVVLEEIAAGKAHMADTGPAQN